MDKIKEIKMLMVDDHHMIMEGYENVLSRSNVKDMNLNIEMADSCDLAWAKIDSEKYDIVMLDINFPVSKESRILSGEDLGIKIKQKYPAIKVIILTVLEDSFRLSNILNNINPEGFLIKGEVTARKLIECLETVITAPPYYGTKISKHLHSMAIHKISLDEKDRKILHELSLGTKTNELPGIVNLSLRAVEDRKRKLKEIFGVSGAGNKALLEQAKKSGYI